ADDAERLARGEREVDAVDRLQRRGLTPPAARADREMHFQVLDGEERTLVRHAFIRGPWLRRSGRRRVLREGRFGRVALPVGADCGEALAPAVEIGRAHV